MDHLDRHRLAWRKSSYSGSNGGNCIEAAATARAIAIRDSHDPRGPILTFGVRDWQRFTRQVKADAGTQLADDQGFAGKCGQDGNGDVKGCQGPAPGQGDLRCPRGSERVSP